MVRMLAVGGEEATIIAPVPLVTGFPIQVSAILNLPITAACGVPRVVVGIVVVHV